jgi:hypothetical protein
MLISISVAFAGRPRKDDRSSHAAVWCKNVLIGLLNATSGYLSIDRLDADTARETRSLLISESSSEPALLAPHAEGELRSPSQLVMPGLVPASTSFLLRAFVDGRDKLGHDGVREDDLTEPGGTH